MKVSQEILNPESLMEARVKIREFDPFDPIYLQEN